MNCVLLLRRLRKYFINQALFRIMNLVLTLLRTSYRELDIIKKI